MNSPAHELDNVVWQALCGAQAQHAVGDTHARRYARGLAPIAALAEPARPGADALRSLHALAGPGELIHLAGVDASALPGFAVERDTRVEQRVWDGSAFPAFDLVAVTALMPAHHDAMFRLAQRTRPGPYGPRSPDLGHFVGIFADGGLVAMAGTRMHAGHWQEISGVCTHPRYAGRGLASVLVRHLVRRAQDDGLRSFLHVEEGNRRARALFDHLGFATVRKQRLLALRRLDH